MAHKVVQFWKSMTEDTVAELSTRYNTKLFDDLPKDLTLIVTRSGMKEYSDMLEPVAGTDINEFLCFAVRTKHDQDGSIFIEEAWGIESDVPYQTSRCFRIL